MMATGAQADVVEVGTFEREDLYHEELSAGMVGHIAASQLKKCKKRRGGDTVTDASRPCDSPLPGYKK